MVSQNDQPKSWQLLSHRLPLVAIKNISNIPIRRGLLVRMMGALQAISRQSPPVESQLPERVLVVRCPGLRKVIEDDFHMCWDMLVKKRDKLQADVDTRDVPYLMLRCSLLSSTHALIYQICADPETSQFNSMFYLLCFHL